MLNCAGAWGMKMTEREEEPHAARARKLIRALLDYHAARSAEGIIPRFPLAGDDILIAAEFMEYGLSDGETIREGNK
jgi:hypothetical protein